MNTLKIDTVKVGVLQTNCYVISQGKKCAIIDPGDEYSKIKKIIGDKKVCFVLLTHHHFDHVGALKYFNKIYDYYNLEEERYDIDGFCFEVIYTKGHTDDSISFYFKEDNVMFTGDFLFKDGIGRTDLGGNDIDMYESLLKIKNYPSNIKIYPGHGESSFLGGEINRYL